MKLRRLILIIGGLVLVAVLLFVGTGWLSRSSDRAGIPTPQREEAPAAVGVRARGEVVPVKWAELSFSTAGSIAEWLVAEGDIVETGTPLGQLDAGPLELALQEAQAGLKTAELELTQAQIEHQRQLAEAELALQIAEDRLAQARARFPSLTAAEVTLQQAIQTEADEAYEYEKAVNRPWEWRFEEVQKAYTKAWQDAKDGLAVAQAEYDAAVAEQYASSQELAILDAEVQRARLELERIQGGEDPLLARQVEQARLQVVRAQAELETATLTAPFDGTVVTLQLQPDDWAQPGIPAITLADLSTLWIETTDLDEWGAAQIGVGSEAEIAFNAFDDKTLIGHIAEIALRGERLPAGDVVYRAVVELDAPDPDLRWGMTVRITFPIEK